MSFVDDMSDTARKIFLAGVGAMSVTAEKSVQLVDDLVKRGEITVEQGKVFNEELKAKAATAGTDTEASILRARMKSMTTEQRDAYVARIAQIKDDLNAEPVEVEGEPVEVEVEYATEGETEAPAEAAAEEPVEVEGEPVEVEYATEGETEDPAEAVEPAEAETEAPEVEEEAAAEE